MNANIKGFLNQLNKSFKLFKYRGKSMKKMQVKAILEFGLRKGYETTNEFSDDEIDKILENLENWDKLENEKLDEHLIKWKL